MKVSIQIDAEDKSGSMAVATLRDIEIEWIATDMADMDRMKEFKPRQFFRFTLQLPDGDFLYWSALGWAGGK